LFLRRSLGSASQLPLLLLLLLLLLATVALQLAVVYISPQQPQVAAVLRFQHPALILVLLLALLQRGTELV
jgi:hypothetical protein